MAEVQRDEPLAVLEDGTEVLGALPASTEGVGFDFAKEIAALEARCGIEEKLAEAESGFNFAERIAASRRRNDIAKKIEGIPATVLRAHPDPFGTAIDIEAA